MSLETVIPFVLPALFFAFWGSEVLLNRAGIGQPFEPVRGWPLVGVVFYAAVTGVGVGVPLWLPPEWLAQHRLMDLTGLGLWGAPIAFLLTSLASYVFHRAEHRFDVMWRGFHQMHHSIERVDMPGYAIAHPTEMFAYTAITTLTAAFVLGVDPTAAAIAGLVVGVFNMFQHWNAPTPYWLGFLVLRPEQHCLHHQRDVHGRNYSGDIALWDQLFGSFQNDRTFEGKVGFGHSSIRALPAMLVFADVNVARSAQQ